MVIEVCKHVLVKNPDDLLSLFLHNHATLGQFFSLIKPAREAESARAFTGSRCPHIGRGEDFLTGQLNFFYGNCCNSGTESQKIVPKVGN